MESGYAVSMRQKNIDVFDLTKFVMAFFIIAIHCDLLPSVLYPWLRIAVPIFFLISGYILFRRVDETEKTACVMRYVWRNLKLYIVWFIILLPVTVFGRRSWFSDGIMWGIFRWVRALLFSGTFYASWFLTANVTAVLLVYGMSKKMKMHWILAIAAVCYFLCCMNSRYYWLAEKYGLSFLLRGLDLLFGKIENSFLVALLWIAIGKTMAEKRTAGSVKRTILGLLFLLCYL